MQFAWPSAASVKSYAYDRESALYSRDALETTIDDLARSDARQISLVAHSMGGFLMMDALRLMARGGYDAVFDKLNAVILISPDIDIDVFRKQAAPVIRRGVPVFVIVSTRDRALLVSAFLRGETDRVGSIRSPDELGDIEVSVIDITGVQSGDALGHFAVATSPALIALLRQLREEGIGNQTGIISSSVQIIQEAPVQSSRRSPGSDRFACILLPHR